MICVEWETPDPVTFYLVDEEVELTNQGGPNVDLHPQPEPQVCLAIKSDFGKEVEANEEGVVYKTGLQLLLLLLLPLQQPCLQAPLHIGGDNILVQAPLYIGGGRLQVAQQSGGDGQCGADDCGQRKESKPARQPNHL